MLLCSSHHSPAAQVAANIAGQMPCLKHMVTLQPLKQRPSLAQQPPPSLTVDKPASAAAALPRRTSSDASLVSSIPADPAPTRTADADPAARWLINVDIDACLQRRDLETLRAADREMRTLAREYHVQRREQDIRHRDPTMVVAWPNLLEAIGACYRPDIHLVQMDLSRRTDSKLPTQQAGVHITRSITLSSTRRRWPTAPYGIGSASCGSFLCWKIVQGAQLQSHERTELMRESWGCLACTERETSDTPSTHSAASR